MRRLPKATDVRESASRFAASQGEARKLGCRHEARTPYCRSCRPIVRIPEIVLVRHISDM